MPDAPPAAPPPATTPTDWAIIQAMYAQGLGPKEISVRTGVSSNVIATRASRGNWSRLTTACASIVHASARNAVRDIVDEESGRARKKLSVLIDRHLDKIPEARSWKHAASLQRDLEPLVRNAKCVYGWGEPDAAGAVRIGVIRNAVIITSSNDDSAIAHAHAHAHAQDAELASIDAPLSDAPDATGSDATPAAQ